MKRFPNQDDDPFKPPETPLKVKCLHCYDTYQSSEMIWERRFDHGPLWWCRNKDCDGAGFGFDLHIDETLQ